MSSATVITDVAGVATAVGVLFGAAQLLLSRGQARTTFEDSLSGQYREIIKPRLKDALLAPLSAAERVVVAPYYEYFDLCNEQVFLRLHGRVSKRTWNEWRQGISANLDRGEIGEAWKVILEREDDLPDFEELRSLSDLEFRTDPRGWNPLWRRVLRCEQGAGEALKQQRTHSASAPGASLDS